MDALKYFFQCSRGEETERESTLFKFCSQIFLVIIVNNFRSLFTKAERKGDLKAYRGRGRQPQKVSVDHNTHNGSLNFKNLSNISRSHAVKPTRFDASFYTHYIYG